MYTVTPFTTASWWFQCNPFEKYARQNGSFPQFSGWKIKTYPPWNSRSTWITAVGVDDSLPFGAPAYFSGAFAVVSFREDIWVATTITGFFGAKSFQPCSKSSATVGFARPDCLKANSAWLESPRPAAVLTRPGYICRTWNKRGWIFNIPNNQILQKTSHPWKIVYLPTWMVDFNGKLVGLHIPIQYQWECQCQLSFSSIEVHKRSSCHPISWSSRSCSKSSTTKWQKEEKEILKLVGVIRGWNTTKVVDRTWVWDVMYVK